MGDINIQGQGDEHLLSLLSKLGDLDQDIIIDPELIKNLANAWIEIKTALSQDRIRDIDRVFHRLLLYTAVAVLDVKYQNKIEAALKASLASAISGVEDGLKTKFQPLYQICSSLGSIVAEPWEYAAFREVGGTTGELTTQLIDVVWANEGVIFLEARLEALARPKKLQMPNIMAKILHILLSKGKAAFSSVPDDDTNAISLPTTTSFDPYHITFKRYIEYLEVYVLLWSKMNSVFDPKVLIDLCPSIMSTVINSLHSKSTSEIAQRPFLPKVWKGNKTLESLVPLISLILTVTLDRPLCNPQGVKALFRVWLKIFMETTEKERQLTKLEGIVDNLLIKKEKIASSDYVYTLSETILEMFSEYPLCRPFYVAKYLKAMLMDVNLIENLRAPAEEDRDHVKLKAEYLRLSHRFVGLAKYFQEFKSTSRELILTAFSLNPIQSLFNQLFPPDEENNKDSPTPSSTSQQIDVQQANNSTTTTITAPCTDVVPYIPPSLSPQESTKEDLLLPENLVDGLRDIAQTPRWGALAHLKKGEELRKLCTKLLEKGPDFLVKEKKLEYVDVDYEKYAHLPSKYDPNDDGIERGYIRPHETRKKMMLMLGQGRSGGSGGFATKRKPWNRKGPLKKQQQQQAVVKKKVTGHSYNKFSNSSNRSTNKNYLDFGDNFTSNKLGRPLKNPEAAFNLELVKQYLNTIQNGPETFGPNSWNPTKKKLVKAHYEKKFLQPSLPFPGDYDWIPDPKPTSFALAIIPPSSSSKSTKGCGKGNYARNNNNNANNNKVPGRKTPSTYIPRKTPLQSAGSQPRLEDELLRSRLDQSKITRSFIGTRNSPRCLQLKCTSIQDLVPETTEAQWEEVEEERGVKISCNKGKLLGGSSSFKGLNAKLELVRDPTIPPELASLTKEYLSLRASTLKFRMEKKSGSSGSGPSSSSGLPPPPGITMEEEENEDPEDLICQERHAMKKVLYNGLASTLQKMPPPKAKAPLKGRRRRRGGGSSLAEKENLVVQEEEPKNNPNSVQSEVNIEKDTLPPPPQEGAEISLEQQGQQQHSTESSNQTNAPLIETEVGEEEKEDNVLQYELGLVWELSVASKQVILPLGPKNTREQCKRNMIINDALERIKNNLRWKSYNWKEVQENAKKEEVDLEEALREEQARKMATVMSAIISPNWTPNVSSGTGEPITKGQTAMAVGRARKKISKMSDIFQGPPALLVQNEFSLPPSICNPTSSSYTNSKGRRNSKAKDDDDDEDCVPSCDEESESEAEDDDESFSSSRNKPSPSPSKSKKPTNYSPNVRKYRYYPDSIIQKAIIAMKNGATMKKASDMFKINRSALCKRLEVMGFRKDGKWFIPPNFKQVLQTFKTGRSKGGRAVDGPKTQATKSAALHKAVGMVVFWGKHYNDAVLATKVPYSTIAHHINFIMKRGKEAKAALQKNDSELRHSHFDDVISTNNDNILRALVKLGKGKNKMSMSRAARESDVLEKDLAAAVEVFYDKRTQEKQTAKLARYPIKRTRTGNSELDPVYSNPTTRLRSGSRRSGGTNKASFSSFEDGGDSLDSYKSSGSNSFPDGSTTSQSESQVDGGGQALLPGATLDTASTSSAVPLPAEIEKPPEKPTMKISFPILRRIAKCSSLVAAPTCPGPTKEILDPISGEIIRVPDEDEAPSKEDEIISRLPPCDWRAEEDKKLALRQAEEQAKTKKAEEEQDGGLGSNKEFQDFEEARTLVTQQHSSVPIPLPDPVVAILPSPVVLPGQDSSAEVVPVDVVENTTQPSLPLVPQENKTQIVQDKRPYHCYVKLNKSEIDLCDAAIAAAASASASTSSCQGEVKRSTRINNKPKLDFKSGTPVIVPNGSSYGTDEASLSSSASNNKKHPSSLSEVVNGSSKRRADDAAVIIPLQNGDASCSSSSIRNNNKKRKIVNTEKENFTTPEITTSNGLRPGESLLIRPSLPSNSSNCSSASSITDTIAAKFNGITKSNTVARKRTARSTQQQQQQQKQRRQKSVTTSSEDEDENEEEEVQSDNDNDPDYRPDEDAATIVPIRSTRKSTAAVVELLPHKILDLPIFHPNLEQAEEFIQPIVSNVCSLRKNKKQSFTSSSTMNPVHLQHNVVLLGSSNKKPAQHKPLSKKTIQSEDPLHIGISRLPQPVVIDISDSSDDEDKNDNQQQSIPAKRKRINNLETAYPDITITPNHPPLNSNDNDVDVDVDLSARSFAIASELPDGKTEYNLISESDALSQQYNHRIVQVGGPLDLLNGYPEEEQQQSTLPPPPVANFHSIEDELDEVIVPEPPQDQIGENEKQFENQDPPTIPVVEENFNNQPNLEDDDDVIPEFYSPSSSPNNNSGSRPEFGEDCGMGEYLDLNSSTASQQNQEEEQGQEGSQQLLTSQEEDRLLSSSPTEDEIICDEKESSRSNQSIDHHQQSLSINKSALPSPEFTPDNNNLPSPPPLPPVVVEQDEEMVGISSSGGTYSATFDYSELRAAGIDEMLHLFQSSPRSNDEHCNDHDNTASSGQNQQCANSPTINKPTTTVPQNVAIEDELELLLSEDPKENNEPPPPPKIVPERNESSPPPLLERMPTLPKGKVVGVSDLLAILEDDACDPPPPKLVKYQ